MAVMLNNGSCRSFNGDGKLDLLCRNTATHELLVYPHSGVFDGERTFGEPVVISTDFSLENFIFARAADITATGRADVVGVRYPFFNEGEHGLYVLENVAGLNGLDTLDEEVRFSGKRDDGREWETVAFADIAGAGLEDSFGREKDAGGVHWWPHSGEVRTPDGTYEKTPIPLTMVDPGDFPLAMADFTRNGKLDLLVLRANGDLDVLIFSASYDFASPEPDQDITSYTLAKGWDTYSYFTLTDVDLDGVPDLLARDWHGNMFAFRHCGKFDESSPLGLFEEPVLIGTGFDRYDLIG